MGNTVTIRFRAKRDEFHGGEGYKVPTLTASHVSFADRDTLATLITGSLGRARDNDMLKARLERFAGGFRLPGVVFDADPGAWTVTPVGKGFMADVSVTLPVGR